MSLTSTPTTSSDSAYPADLPLRHSCLDSSMAAQRIVMDMIQTLLDWGLKPIGKESYRSSMKNIQELRVGIHYSKRLLNEVDALLVQLEEYITTNHSSEETESLGQEPKF